jgi:hypothetical protein
MSQVKVNHPARAAEDPVEVLFLGIFPNRRTSNVTDEQVATFEALSGRKWPKEGVLHVGAEEPHPVAPPEAASKPATAPAKVEAKKEDK